MSDYIPKVGEEFEYNCLVDTWVRQKCTAVAKTLLIGEDANGKEIPLWLNNNNFRPIKSARDKAIDEMLLLDVYPSGEAMGGMMSRREFCGKLYDSGYRKVRELGNIVSEESIAQRWAYRSARSVSPCCT